MLYSDAQHQCEIITLAKKNIKKQKNKALGSLPAAGLMQETKQY